MLVISNQQQSSKPYLACLENDLTKRLNDTPRILLVEDNQLIQDTMRLILQSHLGYHVDVASSGEEAVTLFSREHAVVIMDIGLPGISGIEATKQIKQTHTNNKAIIIAHTAHGDKTVKSQCFAAGFDHFLLKGASPETFKQLIETALLSETEYEGH